MQKKQESKSSFGYRKSSEPSWATRDIVSKQTSKDPHIGFLLFLPLEVLKLHAGPFCVAPSLCSTVKHSKCIHS